jgi:CRP-like cAMP-binding protein
MVMKPDRSTIFTGLTDEQFSHILSKGRRITLQSKSILFNQGDSAEQCYIVNRGCVKLTKLNELGREVILRYISSSEVTAATAVLRNQPYPATAMCVSRINQISTKHAAFTLQMRARPLGIFPFGATYAFTFVMAR